MGAGAFEKKEQLGPAKTSQLKNKLFLTEDLWHGIPVESCLFMDATAPFESEIRTEMTRIPQKADERRGDSPQFRQIRLYKLPV